MPWTEQHNNMLKIKDHVKEWLTEIPRSIHLYEDLNLKGLSCRECVENVYISHIGHSSLLHHTSTIVELDIQVIPMSHEPPFRSVTIEGPDDLSVQIRQTRLPHQVFHLLRESLIYEDDLPAKVIRFATRIIKLTTENKINPHFVYFNRLILLHGPSGTGKTTLSRVIAQALSTHLRRNFPNFLLWELSAASMFSSWFGESATIIDATFEAAFKAASDPHTFICVMIDEVESLAGSRERNLGANEVADSARATNQLLVALDRMREMPNMMMICTSNLISTIDPAFLDRADLKQYIPSPSSEAAYKILLSSFKELVRIGLIKHGSSFESSDDDDINHALQTNLHIEEHPQSSLRDISERCESLSGRTLRRLPYLAIALYADDDTVTLPQALSALSLAVDHQLE
jgi:SpoVK/Ycf46/Vps4 family AAA+-type ATPase